MTSEAKRADPDTESLPGVLSGSPAEYSHGNALPPVRQCAPGDRQPCPFAPGRRRGAQLPSPRLACSNDDGSPHALAFADGRAPSDLLLPGQQYTRAFAAAGVYDYVCSVHPYMSGRVVMRTP